MHTKVESAVLKAITPGRQPALVQKTLKQVESEIRKQQLSATVRLGGSMAKGTYLKNDHDVDVFVRFSPEYGDAELADRLELLLAAVFKRVERVHGSRDYFHVQQEKFTFEFVPVRGIGSWHEAVNVTDMSPLHVDYVRTHTERNPGLAAEIRLTKQFCKAAKVYGAESYIGGFSGHVIDLLIIHYGSFRKLLAAAAQWPAKVILDPEQHHDNPLIALNDAKTYAPLVIVDPIQPDRNSAAAVTEYAFKRFKQVAAEYLATPLDQQKEFFTVKPLDPKLLEKKHPEAELITVILAPLQGKRDVVGAKCLKVYEYIRQELLAHGFSIIAATWEFTSEKTTLLFAVPKEPLPKEEEVAGPPIHRTLDVERFKQAHELTFTRDSRIYAVEQRKYTQPRKLVTDTLKSRYVKDRVSEAHI